MQPSWDGVSYASRLLPSKVAPPVLSTFAHALLPLSVLLRVETASGPHQCHELGLLWSPAFQ